MKQHKDIRPVESLTYQKVLLDTAVNLIAIEMKEKQTQQKIALYDYHMDVDNNQLLIYYKGPFKSMILSQITEDIRYKLQHAPLIKKKVFSIFLELAQNISYYSAERNQFGSLDKPKVGNGSFLISQTKQHFTLVAGNVIYQKDVQKIVDKCKKINKLDKEGLRNFKREIRGHKDYNYSGGGRIGLIDIALKANSPIGIEILNIDKNFSYLILSVQVVKC